MGTIALRAELSIPLSDAVTAGNRNSGHSAGPKSAFSASPALDNAPSASTMSSSSPPVHRVDERPAKQRPAISGNSWVSDTSPTSSDDCVIAYTW